MIHLITTRIHKLIIALKHQTILVNVDLLLVNITIWYRLPAFMHMAIGCVNTSFIICNNYMYTIQDHTESSDTQDQGTY